MKEGRMLTESDETLLIEAFSNESGVNIGFDRNRRVVATRLETEGLGDVSFMSASPPYGCIFNLTSEGRAYARELAT